MGRMCEPSMPPPGAPSNARDKGLDRISCNLTRIAITGITWETSIGPITVPSRKSANGSRSATRSSSTLPGWSRKGWRSATTWRRCAPALRPKFPQASNLPHKLPSRMPARLVRMYTVETREITFAEAIREALAEEMRRDSSVFIIGEDVAEAGTPFKVLLGLAQEFGVGRVIDTPISEPGFTGIAVGAAMTGMRPVVDIMFGDFITLTMDQMVNQAAKIHYMSGGRFKVPMVMRTTLGATRRSAAQHSQSLHALFSHIPGLKVVLPSTPYDAKGLLKSAIRDDNPVAFFEDKMMFRVKGPVPAEDYTIPLGVADIKRTGTDITLVGTSSMVQVALAAADRLAESGISAEVVDPRTTYPLDKTALIESAKKTSRAIVIDEGYNRYGVTAEIASVIAEGAFYYLDAPVKRMGAMDVPVPFSPALEDLTVPTPETVGKVARALCARN